MKKSFLLLLIITLSCNTYSDDVYSNIFLSLNKTYITQFPSDILITADKEPSPSNLTSEKKGFYEKYAGLYFDKDEISIDKQIYNIYQIKPVSGTWGNYYAFGKWSSGIDYISNWNNLYFYDGGCIEEIKDFSKSPFPSNYVKIAGINYTNPFIYSLLKDKENDSVQGIEKSNKISEQQIRSLLTTFFSKLQIKSYKDLYKYINTNNDLVSFGYNNGIYGLSNTYSLNEFFNYMKMTIESNNQPFDVYVNVYFSETYKRILDKFGNATLVEFRFNQSYNYLSFVLTQNNNGVYIVGIRNELDTE